MKLDAYKENLRNELLFAKIKEKTYDTMAVHLKGLIALKSNNIVYNFQIRKITPEEKRKLKFALEIRRMELREKTAREERKEQELFRVDNFCRRPENYIVNGVPGYRPQVLVDYEVV
jgi:hypothetical protein